MSSFAREFTELCARIAEAERRVEMQHDKLARWPSGSDDALYARALAGVLERSLALMYRRRDRLERELRAQRRAERLQRPSPRADRARLSSGPASAPTSSG
jgi:hypothetical protein